MGFDFALPTAHANHPLTQCKIAPIYTHCSCKNPSIINGENHVTREWTKLSLKTPFTQHNSMTRKAVLTLHVWCYVRIIQHSPKCSSCDSLGLKQVLNCNVENDTFVTQCFLPTRWARWDCCLPLAMFNVNAQHSTPDQNVPSMPFVWQFYSDWEMYALPFWCMDKCCVRK